MFADYLKIIKSEEDPLLLQKRPKEHYRVLYAVLIICYCE